MHTADGKFDADQLPLWLTMSARCGHTHFLYESCHCVITMPFTCPYCVWLQRDLDSSVAFFLQLSFD